MRRLRPSGEAEMIALFLRTELPSARFRHALQALLNQAGLAAGAGGWGSVRRRTSLAELSRRSSPATRY
jgi:hypothetical protein